MTHGYFQDHRPDLKFIIDLMCTGDGDVPLYLRTTDGNESDGAIFAHLIQEFNVDLPMRKLNLWRGMIKTDIKVSKKQILDNAFKFLH